MHLIQFLFFLPVPPAVLQVLTLGPTGTYFSSVFHPHLMGHPQPLAALGTAYSPHAPLGGYIPAKGLEISCHLPADLSKELDPSAHSKGRAVMVRL